MGRQGCRTRETRNGGAGRSPAKEKPRKLFGVAILHAYASYKKLHIQQRCKETLHPAADMCIPQPLRGRLEVTQPSRRPPAASRIWRRCLWPGWRRTRREEVLYLLGCGCCCCIWGLARGGTWDPAGSLSALELWILCLPGACPSLSKPLPLEQPLFKEVLLLCLEKRWFVRLQTGDFWVVVVIMQWFSSSNLWS